ncbi:MAG: long-chain fatty acid--CoA ligase [Bacteroidales bacterium]
MDHVVKIVRDRISKYRDREVFRYKDKSTLKYKSISWNQLGSQIDTLSNVLLSLGFGFNDKIGIFSANRYEWVITDLAIMAIRGVVVPLYSTSSEHQVKYIVDETQMRLLFIGNKDQLDKAPWLFENCKSLEKIIVFDSGLVINDPRIISYSEFLKTKYTPSDLLGILEEAKPDELATIIYTSGTTGEPKGAMLGHDNFIQAFKINEMRLQMEPTDVSLCFLPLSHVFERTWTLFLLYNGLINVFLENPREVVQEMTIAKPTVMCTVPRFYEKTYEGIIAEVSKWPSIKKSFFNWAFDIGHAYIEYKKDAKKAPVGLTLKHAIAEKLVFKKLRNVLGGDVRMLPCAGSAISPTLLKFFHAAGLFVNYGYGATETTATVSCFKKDTYNFDYTGSIMSEVEIKISENKEIWIKGKTVFKGYYNKPEETAKVLVDGWYKTGDEGFVVNGEYLMMTDRIKDMIKTSVGKYVSPQKLELLISQSKYIEQVVVFGDNKKFMTALIVPLFKNLEVIMAELNINVSDPTQVVKDEKIIIFFKEQIESYQSDLTSYEKVVKFTLIPENFSIENNALTNTLKIKRKVIEQKYQSEIEKMYLS